jgi:hypothetical protein
VEQAARVIMLLLAFAVVIPLATGGRAALRQQLRSKFLGKTS